MGKICFFVGHSDAPESIYPALCETIENHITQQGVTEFRVGNYGRFDLMAAKGVIEAKKKHPEIKLYLALAYLPGIGRALPDMTDFDGSVYPEGLEKVPYRLAIPRLNRLMLNASDCVIAYVVYSWGGAAATLRQAQIRERKGKLSIFNLDKRQTSQSGEPLYTK